MWWREREGIYGKLRPWGLLKMAAIRAKNSNVPAPEKLMFFFLIWPYLRMFLRTLIIFVVFYRAKDVVYFVLDGIYDNVAEHLFWFFPFQISKHLFRNHNIIFIIQQREALDEIEQIEVVPKTLIFRFQPIWRACKLMFQRHVGYA